MRTTLISMLLFVGMMFVHSQVFAGGSSESSETAKNHKASKARGVTLSGHVVPAPKGPPAHRFSPDSVLVRFKQGASLGDKAIGRQMIMGKKLRAYSLVPGLEHLRIGIPGLEVEEAVRILERLPFVEYAQPNYVISINETFPNDASLSEQWALHNYGQQSSWNDWLFGWPLWGPGTADADIDAPEAWDTITYSNSLVAIIDTGIAYDHPDLVNNIWTNTGETPGNGVDDDGNGYVDDVHGWDFVNNDNDPFDGHGHGSHVAGIVAAEGNNGVSVYDIGGSGYDVGVSGVLWQGHLMALKAVDDDGYGVLSDAIAALEYAVTMGARISNNSWGYPDEQEPGHQALYDAIAAVQADNHLFIAAAGNGDWLGIGINTDTTPHYPSSFDLDNIISVAATDYNDNLAGFSNYGPQSVDLAAPGVQIFSTWTWTQNIFTGEWIPDYAWLDGTSMATPHVTGVAAMISEQHPDWSYGQIRDRLFATVCPLGVLADITVTGGMLNAANAVAVTGNPPTADFSYVTDDLVVTFTDQSDDTDGTVVSWNWSFGDGSSSTDQHPSHTYSDSGTYEVTLTVTDNDGASDTTSQSVTVIEPANVPPVASYSYSCNGLECNFDGSGSTDSDGFIASYQWDFGDGYSSYLQSPRHEYASAGTYAVTLTVTDDLGASDMMSQDVSVNNPDQINAPTNLTADSNGSTVTLNWDDTSGNEDGFAIERAKKIKGKYSFVELDRTDVTFYSDNGVDPGIYKYRIRAFVGTTYSDYSNEALVKVRE